MARSRVLARATLVTAVALSLAAAPACGRFVFASGPDRPDDDDLLGPPPPPDYDCERGSREILDEDRDGHPDGVVHKAGGEVICRGDDTDRNGRIDRWQKLDHGRVVSEAHDSDGDGKLDPPKPAGSAK